MREIKMYQSEDGEIFKTVKECGEHEFKIHAVRVIMGELNDRPNTEEFAEGYGCVQQSSDVVKKAITRIAQLSIVELNDDFYLYPTKALNTMIGRAICESDKYLAKAWYRFQCMDDDYKEWGQPFFAEKRNKQAKDFYINPCCGVIPDYSFNRDTNLYVLKCISCEKKAGGTTFIEAVLSWNNLVKKTTKH